MTITYRTAGAWGAGKGANLTAADVDENFHDLDGRVEDLESNPPASNEISNVTMSGSQLTFFLEDGTTFGPFTVPRARFNWRGDWAAATVYFGNDIVKVAGSGTYLVLLQHTSAATFDAAAEDGSSGDPLYALMVEPGADGATGATGAAGADGADGATGPAGADGADGQSVDVLDEGVPIATAVTGLDFVGAGVSVAANSDGSATVTIPGGGSGVAVEDEGVAVDSAATTLNFTGAGVTAAGDSSGTVTVTIPGGGSGALDDLTDVTLTTAADGDMLRRSGGIWVNEKPVYDLGIGRTSGAPTASEVLLDFEFNRTVVFPSSLTGSVGSATTAATAQTDFDIQKNGSSVGTMRFAASGTTASFIMASATTFSSGDKIKVIAPGTADATLASIAFTLAGTRS